MIMMTVMMAPSTLPWLSGFAAMSRDRESGAMRRGWVVLFGLGYLMVWAGFSVLAASLQMGLRSWTLLEDTLAVTAPLGALLLIGAGVYQVTPAKVACLRHCRTPLSYFLSHWKNGPGGAFRMGICHGAFCVACCWALMLSAFALGLMNLAWMAALTTIVALETLAPGGARIGRIAGAAMVIWGLTLLLHR
jgi:predicted metal-binding membrane protein